MSKTPANKKPLIEVVNATRIIDGEMPTTLVKEISLKIEPGEFVAVTGPSGSGKSSLLYLLGLLDLPTEGEVFVEGNATTSLSEEARAKLRLSHLGFIFQFHFLLPEFTALQNVILPMRALGRLTDQEQEEKARAILISLGLGDHTHKRPGQLSGGQRQRVAIARALANDPLVVLADEPTGNLDSVSGGHVLEILHKLTHEEGRAIVFVTHDLNLAARADRQIHIIDGQIARDRTTQPEPA